MRNFVLLVVCLMLYQAGVSQGYNQSGLRTLYFHDGSVYRGKVLKEDVGQIVMIVTTGDTLHVDKSLLSDRPRKIKHPKFHYTNGFFASVSQSVFMSGYGSQADLILGYRLNEKYALGVGVGSHNNDLNFNDLWASNSFIPVYAYARKYIMNKKKVKPFLYLKAGYGFQDYATFIWFEDHHSGGMYFQPGIGINLPSRNKFRLVMTLSQYMQYTEGSQRQWDAFSNPIDFNYKTWISRVVFKLGIEFR